MAATSSCDDDTATQPTSSINIDKTTLEVNESMTIHFTGDADNVVIYTGDTDHDYNLRTESNYGLVVNKGLMTYSYSTPGVYKVVCVATNHENVGKSLLTDTCSVYVRVIDDITTIDKISAPQVLYDEVFAKQVNDVDWVMPLPRKIKYKTSNPSVSLQQKLKFYIESTTTQIYVDDELFNSNSKYNLANKHTIKAVSNEGTERSYTLHTLNYGEFKTFKLAGVTGTITRTEYDYSYYEINMELPAGTDLTSLVPEFTLYGDNEVPYIGTVAQQSGVNAADFSQPVTYRFVVTDKDNPQISIESTCKVTVTLK
jgi:hypothetical protein